MGLRNTGPMTTQTQNSSDPATGPMRHLAAAGLSTRRIAELLNLSQSTVVRGLRKARTEESAARRLRHVQMTAYSLFMACMLIITIAIVHMSWR